MYQHDTGTFSGVDYSPILKDNIMIIIIILLALALVGLFYEIGYAK